MDERHPAYVPLMTAICVQYARPFTANEGMGALPAKYARFSDPALQQTHDNLISSRHELYAHSDLSREVLDPTTGKSEPLHQLLVTSRHDNVPEGTQISYFVGVSELNLRMVNIPAIMAVCQDIQARLNQEIKSLKALFFATQPVLPPGIHKFPLNDES